MNNKLIAFVIVIAVLLVGYLLKDRILWMFYSPTTSSIETGVTIKKTDAQPPSKPNIEVVAENLDIPWEIVFLPSGEMLVTERSGNLLKIGTDRKVINIDGVNHFGEGGLLGLALHPDFASNNFIYLYFTSGSASSISNRVERYKLEGETLTDKTVIISGIPGAANHDGGRIRFGPDGYLYITTGDSQNSSLSQDKNSLAGKILRVKDDGGSPSDNLFNSAVYSYGHRNVQGIAWDSQGRLWATEHGRSGVQSGLDEVNLIVKGGNYGWPTIQGNEIRDGMVTPVINSGASDTWAPSGMVFYNGKLFWAGLRGESLYEAVIRENKLVSLKANFRSEYGRLRTVVIGPDGYFYILTNNTDGRGTPSPGDDKIIRVNPVVFK